LAFGADAMREEEEEGEEEATLSDISLPFLHRLLVITARGQRRNGNIPGCDSAGVAWLRAAPAMTCGVRPTRGGVEPKERWM
jgi:hypothetical protein